MSYNTLKYKDSWVKFEDCIEGMKELPDKSVDLCLTDPPYNIGLDKGHITRRGTNLSKKILYNNDQRIDYIEWCKEWYSEILRICDRALIFCGRSNWKKWIKYIDFDMEEIIWYDRSKQGGASVSHFNKIDPILCKNMTKQYPWNVIEEYCIVNQKNYNDLVHPVPKEIKVIQKLLRCYNPPSSVLDPFMGSGTTLEACIQLGIPCYGYELMEEYRADMEKRIERSKFYRRPVKLDAWFEVDENELQKELGSNSIL